MLLAQSPSKPAKTSFCSIHKPLQCPLWRSGGSTFCQFPLDQWTHWPPSTTLWPPPISHSRARCSGEKGWHPSGTKMCLGPLHGVSPQGRGGEEAWKRGRWIRLCTLYPPCLRAHSQRASARPPDMAQWSFLQTPLCWATWGSHSASLCYPEATAHPQ